MAEASNGKWLRVKSKNSLFEDVESVKLIDSTKTVVLANFPMIELEFVGLFKSKEEAMAE